MSSPEPQSQSPRSLEHPPEAWPSARRFAKRALAPVERFLAIQAASGIVLLLAAAAALVWANSPWRDSYTALWHTPFGLRVGGFSFERDLHFWINDGLMAIFFFVVGLEIRREIHQGELSEARRAALPLAAALGGMVVPAGIFLALNGGQPSSSGWGIPMATDIAFAVGVLALLGKRVPPALRVLLLALAVIDDVGAILVIAIFYSTNIVALSFVGVAAGIGVTLLFQAVGIRSPWAYIPPALVIWASAYGAGVHPTLAGVIVGLLTPVRAWLGTDVFVENAAAEMTKLKEHGSQQHGHSVLSHLDQIEAARREAVSPVERLEHALHGWVAFGVMPLFALANAGVTLGAASFEGSSFSVFVGVLLGLLVGKPLGIVGFSWLATRLNLAVLPRGISWAQVGLVGLVGGIGFTMALFIAALAFPPGEYLETAKIAILGASAIAALGATVVGRLLLPRPSPYCAETEHEAERSTVM